jgi:RNA polymerase sigma factor (sigma-70 family)
MFMASRPLQALLRHLGRATHPRPGDGPTDAQLLERFVQQRDETAFEVLVWRHGGMVFNVCRRVLHHEHDAEDAFQATFLALVRKATAIGKRESVGSWLYKVAYRVALRARATAPLPPLPEQPLPDPSAADPVVELAGREFDRVVDEEIHRLADKYRVAFVLCHLEGQTIEAAARILGCPPGTVGTRVARARALLRTRLSRRGVDPADALTGRSVGTAVPVALVGSTVQAALLDTTEQAVAAEVISPHVADLTKGVLRTMFLTKSLRACVLILGLGLVGGMAVLAHRARGVEAAVSAVQFAARPAERETEAVLLTWKFVPGRPFYQEMTTETEQTMTVMGNDVHQKQKQTFFFRWTPVRRDGDKHELEQRVERVAVEIEIGGSKISFDSTRDQTSANPLATFYKALVGSRFQVTLDKEYQVQKIEGRDKLVMRLAAADKELEKVVRQVLSEDALRRTAESPFAGLPVGPVRKGDSWTRKRKLDLPSGVVYEATYRYTYEGREGKLDRVAIKLERIQVSGQADKDLTFRIGRSGLRPLDGSGVLLFDREKGRTVLLDSTWTLGGRLQIEIGGKEAVVNLKQREKITVRTTDTLPHPPAAEPVPDRKEDSGAVQRLLLQRRDVLRKALIAAEEKYGAGRMGYAAVARAARELLEAELEVSTTPAERRAAYERWFVQAVKMDEQVTAGFKAGRHDAEEFYAAWAERLRAEIELRRAEGSVPGAFEHEGKRSR